MERKSVAQAGDFLKPDGWAIGERMTEGDLWLGGRCDFRIRAGLDGMYNLAINITDTGKILLAGPSHPAYMYKNRVKIEFVGDDEPSEFTHGWLFHNEYY